MLRLILDSAGWAEYAGAVKTSSGLARSRVNRAVISLVVLAIARRVSGSFWNMTAPSLASTTIADLAVSTAGAAAARAGAASTSNASATATRRRRLTPVA